MVASGEGWGKGIVREFGMDMYTLGFSGGASGKEPAFQCRRFKGMATHSSIFVWRITWTEEPDGLQSIASQRAGHN